MANKIFQNIVYQLRDIIDRKIGIMDDEACIIACSDTSMIDTQLPMLENMEDEVNGVLVLNGFTYKAVGSKNKTENIVFVEGEDEEAKTCASIISVSLSNMKNLYDEKYDKANFIKNIILDNVLPGDVTIKAKKLRIPLDTHRVALLIHAEEVQEETAMYDLVQGMFPDKEKDFVLHIDDQDIVVILDATELTQGKDIEEKARQIADTIETEMFVKVNVGIGTVAENIKELARSFKEAQVTLEVGKVFDTEKNIISYENLGIGRLIYQLPTKLCEMFLQEVFKKGSIELLDSETIITIQKFFENNLNVSETSRKLYVHRNTLVYRLDKIYKLTGLDLRTFDDAIVFKVAMMVKKYLSSNPIKI